MTDIPVEKIAEAMGKLIDDGLIGGWGLSQVDVDVIEKAQKVTPLTAIQNIYSMVERDAEARVIPYCMEHNIGFVPFSPIASGLLSGRITPQTNGIAADAADSHCIRCRNLPVYQLIKRHSGHWHLH